MPLMVITSCGCRFNSTSACFNAVSTPKSPQPGHQSGSTLPLKSLTVSRGSPAGCWPVFEILASISTGSTLIDYSLIDRYQVSGVGCQVHPVLLNHDLVHRHIFLSRARQNLLNPIDNMMRHKRLAIVLTNVTVGDDAGFGAQVARELSAVVILYDDELLTLGNYRHDGFAMERNHPLNLEVIGGNAFFVCQLLHSFANDPFR